MLLLALPQGAQQFASPLCPRFNVTFQLGHCDTWQELHYHVCPHCPAIHVRSKLATPCLHACLLHLAKSPPCLPLCIIVNVFPCSPMAFTISTCGGVSTRAFFDVAFFSQAHTQHVGHRELVETSKNYSLVTYCQHEACKSKKNRDSYGKPINHEQP
jgi:hypothetical protein